MATTRRISTDTTELRGKIPDQRLNTDEVIQQLLSVKDTDDKQVDLTYLCNAMSDRRHGDSLVGKEIASTP